MIKIKIPYIENKNNHILLALDKIREHSIMEFKTVGVLRDMFHSMKDISCDISEKELPELLEKLEKLGFIVLLENNN
ncbi:hypothetical protein [Taibaiella soli]|uniref:Uncharacterized protein n=1 Tax=Taibaiella soli TaxID=1649169 RepID=A0A2W2AF32_9BACT|nr:hypothetical protein [Taibaiella soli]PZF73901.1 hypothetical protein DN068_06045 [Taibaiella soli]